MWESKDRNIHIQHALNETGEVQIGQYFVDGYCYETKEVFEYNGCFWHGCPTCYPLNREEVKNVKTRESLEQMYEKTKLKQSRLEQQGYQVITKWQHDFQQDLKTNADLID